MVYTYAWPCVFFSFFFFVVVVFFFVVPFPERTGSQSYGRGEYNVAFFMLDCDKIIR